MVYKNCKRDIDDDSIFCKWCGEKQIRERRKKSEVKVPKPKQLASGEYIGQIMLDGQRHTVKGATLAEYEARCRAYKTGVVEAKRGVAGVTVGELVDSYLLKNSNVLSPGVGKKMFCAWDRKKLRAIPHGAFFRIFLPPQFRKFLHLRHFYTVLHHTKP